MNLLRTYDMKRINKKNNSGTEVTHLLGNLHKGKTTLLYVRK